MEQDLQQAPRKRTVTIECTDREWFKVKLALLYTDTEVGKLTKNILLRWAEKNQTPPQDKQDNELAV